MAQLLFNYDPATKSLLVQFVDPAQGTPQAPKVLENVPIAPAELDGFLSYVTQAVNWVKSQGASPAHVDAPASNFAGDFPEPNQPAPAPAPAPGPAVEPAAPVTEEAKLESLKKALDDLNQKHDQLAGVLGFGPFGGGGGGLLGGILGPILGGGGGGYGGGGWGGGGWGGRGPWGPRPAPVVVVAPQVGGGYNGQFGGFGGGYQQPVWGGGYQQPVVVAPQPVVIGGGGGYQTVQIGGVQPGTQIYQGLQLQGYVNGQPALLQFV